MGVGGACAAPAPTDQALLRPGESMPKEFSRTQRLGEQIRRELAELIQFEVRDPRIGLVTVSGVEVTRDLSLAKVYVTLLGDEDPTPSLEALNNAAGFLRRELGRRLTVRTLPTLRFVYDESVVRGERLSRLIAEARAKERNDDNED